MKQILPSAKTGSLFNIPFLTGLLLLVVSIFSSCYTAKPPVVFSQLLRDTVITFNNPVPGDLKIRKGDKISIHVSSLDRNEDGLYNGVGAGTAGAATYQVGEEGEIFFHRLGKIKVEGMTRKEVKLKMEKDLQPYLKDPLIVVNFTNHHITLMGESGKTMVMDMPEERITLLDLLAQSGPSATTSKLDNVLVIRENAGTKELKHLNLEDHSVFNSPLYYLQPNDIVVIHADEKSIRQKNMRDRYQQFAGITLQTLSAALLIYQVFFK